jgi:hypothetical protein
LTKEEHDQKAEKLSPIVKSLRGSFKIPKEDMNYKKELRKRLEGKYV